MKCLLIMLRNEGHQCDIDVTGDFSLHHLVKVAFGKFSSLKVLFSPFPLVLFRTESPSHFAVTPQPPAGTFPPVGHGHASAWGGCPSQGCSEPPGVSTRCEREQSSLRPCVGDVQTSIHLNHLLPSRLGFHDFESHQVTLVMEFPVNS